MGKIERPSAIEVAQAKLPLAYETAKVALAQCVDECKTRSDKAAAIAAYAKMADDETLHDTAVRI